MSRHWTDRRRPGDAPGPKSTSVDGVYTQGWADGWNAAVEAALDELRESGTATSGPLVPFIDAKPHEHAYTYQHPDGEMIGEHGWVTELEYFEDRDEAVTLVRKRWVLVEVDTIILPDPLDNYGA